MTTGQGTDGWTAVVRRRLALGRLLPMGAAADGAWLTEAAAVTELRRAARTVPGAVPGRLRISPTGPDSPGEAAVTPPPGALPPGPLRIDGEFDAVAGEPLPALTDGLRAALFSCATNGLGLPVTEVDLRVTGLLDAVPESAADAAPMQLTAVTPEDGPALVAAGVPGVAYLTATLGRAVARTPGHLRVELATAAGHRPPTVARAVREAVAASVHGAPSVAVLVTAVEVTAGAPRG